MKSPNDQGNSCLDNELEEMVLEYAIDTFPYTEAFEYLPGYDGDDRQLLIDLIDAELLKIGFYYEEMQENFTIFYFLQIYDETFIVLGLDSKIRVEISSEDNGIFQLDESQYIDLCQIRPN